MPNRFLKKRISAPISHEYVFSGLRSGLFMVVDNDAKVASLNIPLKE